MPNSAATLLKHLGNTEDGVFAVDNRQQIILWSPGAERILGYTAAEVLGRPCFEVIEREVAHADAACKQDCNVLLITRQGSVPPTLTVQSKTKSGKEVWLSITHITIPKADSPEPEAIVHIFRDVSEQTKAQDLVERLAMYVKEMVSPPASTGSRPAKKTETGLQALTPRELEVLGCLAEGLGTGALADRMVISVSTARNHIQNILEKLGVHSRTEAVMYGIRHGLVSVSITDPR